MWIISVLIIMSLVTFGGGVYYATHISPDPEKLIVEYLDETVHMSFTHMMRKAPTYKKIIDLGESAVPAIINEIRCAGGSVALYALLWELTGVRPNHPMENGFVKIDVKAEEKAWLKWAKEKGI
ncbi:MAG: hypothetical protein M0R80_07800 [Proteobacteria bacterium]|jgi:hypothetical protein|nr:hypothetical protein [Pseudomonadota bacterium]